MYFNTIFGSETGRTRSSAASNARTFRQQAIDYDLQLTAFSLILKLPYCEAMSEYRSLILRLHTEVRLR